VSCGTRSPTSGRPRMRPRASRVRAVSCFPRSPRIRPG
jgi:hypothetical protein